VRKAPHKEKMPIFTWRQKLGNPDCIYAERWIFKLPLNLGSFRLHHFFRSDDGRAHHDHPWWFITLVLKGSYVDESPCENCDGKGWLLYGRKKRQGKCRECGGVGVTLDQLHAGSIRYRPAKHKHTLITHGVWTIVFTGPWERRWGFWDRIGGGKTKFLAAKRYFYKHGHHPCDQP
jgi:hypothetical protein